MGHGALLRRPLNSFGVRVSRRTPACLFIAAVLVALGCHREDATATCAPTEDAGAQPWCGEACVSAARGDLVIPYPGTLGASASSTFEVEVNGTRLFVESFADISYVHFAFAGTAHVQIRVAGVGVAVASYVLSPRSFNIVPTICGSTAAFNLTVPRKLLFRDPVAQSSLILLADSLEDEPFAPGSPGVIDIASYGVTPNGATPSTAPIQKALDDLASRTDGVLYFGAGTYLTGSLRVGSTQPSTLLRGRPCVGLELTPTTRRTPSSPTGSRAANRPYPKCLRSSSTMPSARASSVAESST